ncbi:MAG TPA: hypothetical protein VIF57_00435 [Polyangia bacterium]|jgi:hypothetical protein
MQRARLALMVIACLGGAGCGPNLPERMWRSDDVRYFSRAGDDAVCPALLDELEQHGQVIADVLMIDRTLVSYYKFDGRDDFDANAECDPGASACAPNATVRSPVDFDRHELIHAYLSPYGRPPWLLAEGAAVALSCQHYPRPQGDWRALYGAPHSSPALYGAGGWLVGYLLKMFPSRYLAWLYNRLAVNASADQFAAAVKDIYMMDLDAIWPAVIGGPGQPMRCPWECGRPAFATDGAAHPLSPVCAGGTLQRSVAVENSGLSRWRIDGAGRFQLGSCDGSDAPMVSVSGTPGPGELLAPLSSGSYFIDAVVEAGGAPTLSAAVTPGDGLSWSTCAAAPALPDDLSALSTLTLFYPSSTTPQFTSFAGATARGGVLTLTSDDPTVSASLCASCDPQTCATTDASGALASPAMSPGAVLSVPAGAAVSASFFWH